MSIVAVSGGFDPYHNGHADMIREAYWRGDVVAILNSDEWLMRKKGFVFMPFAIRKAVMESIKGVLRIESVDDSDGTVCEALARIRPDFFANGGDRVSDNTPELKLCTDLGIKPLFNVGGGKVASSSELANAIRS